MLFFGLQGAVFLMLSRAVQSSEAAQSKAEQSEAKLSEA